MDWETERGVTSVFSGTASGGKLTLAERYLGLCSGAGFGTGLGGDLGKGKTPDLVSICQSVPVGAPDVSSLV